MSGAAAIAASASAQSAIAAQQAREARKVACQALMPSYQDATASVESRQSYASCVDLIYPQTMSGVEVLIVKLLIVSAVIGTVIGMYIGAREDGFIGSILIGMVGMLGVPCVLGVFGMLGWGVTLLF